MARPHPAHIITDDSAIGGKIIERSLRNDEDSSSFLSYTPSVAGNQKTFTLSAWFKLYKQDANQQDFFWMCGGDSSNRFQVSREGVEQINFEPKVSGSTQARFYTSNKFEDVASWYHFVFKIDTTQGTSSNRYNFYINGVETEYGGTGGEVVTTSYPSQNTDFLWGSTIAHYIGRRSYGDASKADIGIAELHYTSGYAYDATSFGYFDDQTGIWRPKKFTGSYGSAGWYLDLSDNTSTTTLGYDKSGNGNHWTLNNYAVTDSILDTPTNNFAVWNVTDAEGRDNDFSEGNLKNQIAYQGNAEESGATLSFSSGKWYWEEYMQTSTDNSGNVGVGVKSTDFKNHWRVRGNGGETDHNGTQTTISGFSWTNGDIIGIAVDMDAGTWTVSKNGTFIGVNIHTNLSGYTVTPTMHNSNGSERHTFITNFGQDSSFAGTKTAQGNKDANGIGDFYYQVPSGYKALCTLNLPPTSSSIIRPKRHFDTLLYTGTGSSNIVEGLEFQPDLVWVHARDTNGYEPMMIDSVRGGTKSLTTNSNDQESTHGGRSMTFYPGGVRWNSDSGNCNANGENYVLWCWKAGGAAVSNTDGSITTSCSANQEAGFSIITYTGTGSQTTVGHGLGKAPKVVITKLRDTTTQDWFFMPGEITGNRATYIKFNTLDAVASDAHTYPNVAPTSTVYTIGGDDGGNGSNGNGYGYVAYCWSEIPGYSRFGLYTANGNADGPYVDLGFRPAFFIIRKVNGENWAVYDNKRDTRNEVGQAGRLYGDLAQSESGVTYDLNITSNGFKLKKYTGIINDSSSDYIYMAFADKPGATPFVTSSTSRS